jgi:hypothetical protein
MTSATCRERIGSACFGVRIKASYWLVVLQRTKRSGFDASSRGIKVPVRDCFSTILPGLADLPIRRLPDLIPDVWVARHS